MEYVAWEKKYKSNIALIDSQHQILFNIINNLFDAMKFGKGNEIIGEILNELLSYTDYHFNAEENLMKENQYVNLDSHLKAHKEFVQKVLFFYQRYISKESALSIDIIDFLKDWLISHILTMDLEFTRTIKADTN
jgi:hemerythrin-like metal-binding protein